MGVCNGNTPTVAVNGTASGSTTISVDGSYQNQLLIEDFIISYNSTLVANSYGIATASGSTGTANDLIDKGNIIGYDNAANMTIYSSHMSNLHAWSYSSATVGFNLTGSATWLSNMEVDGPIASYAYEFSGGGGLNGPPFYLSQSEFLQSVAAGGYAVYVNTATPVVASNNLFHSAGSASEFVQDFYGDSSYLVNNNNMSLLYSGASLAGGNLMSGYGSPNGYRYGQPGDLFVDHVNAKLYVQQNTTPANTGWVQK